MSTFTFDTDDLVLSPIGEEDDGAESVTESYVEIAKMRTATLAAEAEKEMAELMGLLGNLKSGTATQNEKDRVRSLNAKLGSLKRDIAISKERDSKAEMALLMSETQSKALALRTALKKREIASVVKAVCDAESVDLCFVVDCTGSMAGHIASVKQNIGEIVRQVQSTNGALKLRLAFVAYRGVADDARGAETLDFVTSIQEFESFLRNVRTDGGDCPLANVAGGMKRANGLSWRHASRVVFLICDYPCHGSEFHDGHWSPYPHGTPGIDIVAELRRLQSNPGNGTMSLNFGRITVHTETMIRRFQSYGIEFDVVDMQNIGKVTAFITKGIRKSIFKTMTVTQSNMGQSVAFAPLSDMPSLLQKGRCLTGTAVSLKSYRVLTVAPSSHEWKVLPAVKVTVFRNRRINSMNDLQEPLKIGWLNMWSDPSPTWRVRLPLTLALRRAKEPFAEGEIRIAFHAQLARKEAELGNEKNAWVLKSFKHVGKGLNDREQYFKQMEVSTIAHFLACEFNKSIWRPTGCKIVEVLQVCVVEEETDANERVGFRRYCAEQPLPSNEFIKFSNNTGYWNDEYLREALVRFTEFTFHATNGFLMVTDLQGVEKDGRFVLTDPVILCRDILRFGHTNLGEEFMAKCIQSARAHMHEHNWN